MAQLGIESHEPLHGQPPLPGLDEQVRIFRERPLEGRYPYLWLDAKVERVRESPAACATRRWWSPTACTRRAGAR